MEKFKNTKYFHHNGELFNKNKKRLLKDKNRYRITNNGKKISVLSSDIQQIISSNFKTIEEYYDNKNVKNYKIFLPSDIYEILEKNNLMNSSVVIFINKIFSSDGYSTTNLPQRFRGYKPIEISKKYLEKIGLKKQKKNKKSELEKLKHLEIITQIPYEIIYKNEVVEVDFLRNSNHCKRYVVNYHSDKLVSFEYSFINNQFFSDNYYAKKRKEGYMNLFKIIRKKELVLEFENDILIIENERKTNYLREIASIKQLIDVIENHDDDHYRNNTNNREEKLLNRIENRNRNLRDKYTNIKQLNTIDITCSQLRFLYIFLANPNSILFKETNLYYKDQFAMNKEYLEVDIVLLKKNLSKTDFWLKMMEKYGVSDKSILKTDLMTFLAAHNYSKFTKYFGKDYPKISEFLCAINKRNKQENIQENEFIIELQKAESKFVIDITTDVLLRLNIDIFTLHDQWFFEEKNSDVVQKVIHKFTSKYFEGLTNNYK